MTDEELHKLALEKLTDLEVDRMLHCIGWDHKHRPYSRGGMRYFKPYRNYYDAGGADVKIWEGLEEKGFADGAKEDKNGGRFFWLNMNGLNMLSAYKEVFIYDDAANGNEIDASAGIIDVLLADAVYCGYGCWIPSGAKSIALRARLPYSLTIKTLKYLQDKCGYVKHVYEGGVDDEGFPHCTHGWTLTKKWIDENQKRYKEAQEEEYKRMDFSWEAAVV